MSSSTTVAHLGVLRVRWTSMSSGCRRTGRPGPLPHHGVDQRAGDVHVGQRVAELVGLGLLHLDRPFAHDRPLVPAGPGRLQVAEDPLQQPALEQPVGLGRELVSVRRLLQALLLGHLRMYSSTCRANSRSCSMSPGSAYSRQLVHVDHADLAVLAPPPPVA